MTTPTRTLLITSLGNPKPYLRTRHSAGHILLDALTPLLSSILPANLYKTWRSPSLMNVSGPKLARQVDSFRNEHQHALLATGPGTGSGLSPTLVILHDELEAALGKVTVKMGGPEKASLKGHRGLVSVFESLRGKGLYPPPSPQTSLGGSPGLAVMRVGIGIGRPASREKGRVADYVLSDMSAHEVQAVTNAAGFVVKVLEKEVYRVDG